jgi:hypothetical protein
MFIYRIHVKQLVVLCRKIYAPGREYLGSCRSSPMDMGSKFMLTRLAGVEASTHTFFGMLEGAIIHASIFASKFVFGTRKRITLV